MDMLFAKMDLLIKKVEKVPRRNKRPFNLTQPQEPSKLVHGVKYVEEKIIREIIVLKQRKW
jgi:hypothetical protein